MKYQTSLATILLSAAIIAAPGFTSIAYAHDCMDKPGSVMHYEHGHMSKANKELLHATFRKLHESNKPVFEELHKLYKERHEVLAAKTFDKDSYLSVSAKIEEKRAQLEKSKDEAFASIAAKFTPEERERMGHMMGRHHRHHHHHHGMHHEGWKHGEGHEGWHHHEGQNEGANDKAQTPTDNNKEDAAPASAPAQAQ